MNFFFLVLSQMCVSSTKSIFKVRPSFVGCVCMKENRAFVGEKNFSTCLFYKYSVQRWLIRLETYSTCATSYCVLVVTNSSNKASTTTKSQHILSKIRMPGRFQHNACCLQKRFPCKYSSKKGVEEVMCWQFCKQNQATMTSVKVTSCKICSNVTFLGLT